MFIKICYHERKGVFVTFELHNIKAPLSIKIWKGGV